MATKRQPALQRDSCSLDRLCNTFKRIFEYAGGENIIGLKSHFCLLSFIHNEILTSIAHKLRYIHVAMELGHTQSIITLTAAVALHPVLVN